MNYNAWNTLEIQWDANTDLYSYFVNNALGGTVQGDGVAVGISTMIMQAYNFNDPTLAPNPNNSNTDYTAEWSNTPSNVVPEPASIALMGAGLLALAGFARRRRTV